MADTDARRGFQFFTTRAPKDLSEGRAERFVPRDLFTMLMRWRLQPKENKTLKGAEDTLLP
jgi:hypothetical protein